MFVSPLFQSFDFPNVTAMCGMGEPYLKVVENSTKSLEGQIHQKDANDLQKWLLPPALCYSAEMARVNTYLNFMGNTEEAFNFYKEVFGTEFTSITRMKDMPRPEGAPQLLESDADKIMNIQLPITNGHVLMATDALESLGHSVNVGNNVTISLDLDSAEEAERIYSQLMINSKENSGPLAQMPWGALWGSCQDQYGIRWMISFAS